MNDDTIDILLFKNINNNSIKPTRIIFIKHDKLNISQLSLKHNIQKILDDNNMTLYMSQNKSSLFSLSCNTIPISNNYNSFTIFTNNERNIDCIKINNYNLLKKIYNHLISSLNTVKNNNSINNEKEKLYLSLYEKVYRNKENWYNIFKEIYNYRNNIWKKLMDNFTLNN